ncbi:hypothetical protein [Ginsengibacter hankyongi]|nr:hypothetical protein [Ginsengibacter hankyongi]
MPNKQREESRLTAACLDIQKGLPSELHAECTNLLSDINSSCD